MPVLSRIFVYPIKSLAGLAVSEAHIIPGGGLEHDREFALYSAAGEQLRAKGYPRLHGVFPQFDLAAQTVTLIARGSPPSGTLHLLKQREAVERWFSAYLGIPVTLRRDTQTGFPDDLDSPGPTLISTETLDAVCSWFPEIDRDQAVRRFRPNLEIHEVPAFWEDRLFGPPGETVEFRIGHVRFDGVNPCARCPVPPRHPETGDSLPGFQKTFSDNRRDTLPVWAEPSRFDHFYRLSVNTRVPKSETGKVVRVGDVVEEVN